MGYQESVAVFGVHFLYTFQAQLKTRGLDFKNSFWFWKHRIEKRTIPKKVIDFIHKMFYKDALDIHRLVWI